MTERAPESTASLRVAGPADFEAAFAVGKPAIERLTAYADALALWQKRINLVSPATIGETWHRHFADSAQIVPLAPPAPETWVDIGSGAGFPGLVVAILLADRLPKPMRMTLIESDQKKCAFLGEVLRQVRLPPIISVDILCARIEHPATQSKVVGAEVVSARALASLNKLLALASPLMAPHGVGLFLKGRGVEAEVTAARQSFRFAYEVVPSRTDTEAGIVVMRGPAVEAKG
jgi:16S rRNA (guanine527-N7)-methyltransferase